MKFFTIFLIFCLFYCNIKAHTSNPGLTALRQLLERPSKMAVIISPEKRGDPKINPTSARSGRAGQWDFKGSEGPLILLEDLINEIEYADTDSARP